VDVVAIDINEFGMLRVACNKCMPLAEAFPSPFFATVCELLLALSRQSVRLLVRLPLEKLAAGCTEFDSADCSCYMSTISEHSPLEKLIVTKLINAFVAFCRILGTVSVV
jgi:hypothetical protein